MFADVFVVVNVLVNGDAESLETMEAIFPAPSELFKEGYTSRPSIAVHVHEHVYDYEYVDEYENVIKFCRDSLFRDRIYPERSEGSRLAGIKLCVEILRLKPQDRFCRETRQNLIRRALLPISLCAPSRQINERGQKASINGSLRQKLSALARSPSLQPSVSPLHNGRAGGSK